MEAWLRPEGRGRTAALRWTVWTLLVGAVALGVAAVGCQSARRSQSPLRQQWESNLTQEIGTPGRGEFVLARMSDHEIDAAIRTLMTFRGDRRPSTYGSGISFTVSQIFPNPPVEVVALYEIRYLLSRNWNHAEAIALHLRDGSYQYNTKASIEDAWQSYETWFEQFTTLGLEETRRRKLDPMADCRRAAWYGQTVLFAGVP